MKFNSYGLIARVFPAILSSLPFLVLHFFYLRPVLGQFWSELVGMQIVSDVTVSLVFLFLLIQISRYVSKELFEKRMFNDGLALPTTNNLMHGTSYYSSEYKKQIHSKIQADFGIEVPTPEAEMHQQIHSRKVITEAVSRIRAKVGAGVLVDQHNAEYGFARNLVGGSIVAACISVFNTVISLFTDNLVPLWISGVLTLLYMLVVIFSKKLITAFGNSYARVLIQEYMSG